MEYPVGQVAGFAGVTVRTLHHYDGIGLLSPSGRSRAGHRRYDDGDLDRLQQILFYRELGFPLDEIAVLLDDPGADPQEHLRRQHQLLSDRIAELRRMADAVETAMEARKMGIDLTPEEKFEVFGGKDPEEHAEEAEARWGGTAAYAESQRRAAGYTKGDWKRMQAEVAEWSAAYDALMEAGEPATGERAMDLAEAHRLHIGKWFYECTAEMHRGLGEMYVSDERFRAFYDSMRPGLAEHLRDAIDANARRLA
ncbi:MerR family transcriptional regulator [Streptomyces sp. NBC_00257]|uniref:MerR family transcriptional regulator n=1 Tax=unclassified Streptomyces TaxID=2593676 RepID=UPI002256F5E8|nr:MULTISPECIES: MerR family transcriptional regulator [unclassified Streptomyces]MCX5430814.1 MerR family transcriptional regulator [Streptomyces sp. NBC_00062]WTB55085.1 MerR family transcriptional regulator [Streptomyces sp. NBC_00826]WTH92030.1 MerR family transcriptional regulator [Streptomyces sp. NBC_00825]WTI00758.1 MerR family transcriptional regulator [Streptomyces sp. NBC_00822]